MADHPPCARTAVPWLWLALVLGAAAVYLFGLGSPYAPTNGDEMVYIHIARLTAQSGHWLPLVSDLANMRNTKPPLLFWQAVLAGDWGQQWSLLALRLPSVAYTFMTTALLAWLTLRISGRLRSACIAAALYLLFFSTFRYGRVYLTSAPETFWFALPLFWLLWLRLPHPARADIPPEAGLGVYTLMGMSMGIGMAYKSFALLAPASATLWLALLWTTPAWNWRSTLRTSAGLTWSALLALGVFGLWFVLDPDPGAVWREFVVGENAGKLSGKQGYWHAAFFGDYPLWTQLFAYPINAGLLVFTVLGFLLSSLRGAWRLPTYATLGAPQRVLLVWLVVWLVAFSIPSQREARYVIPAMPALAMLMALDWDRLGRIWFWLTLAVLAPALVMLARVAWVMGDLQMANTAQTTMTLIAACAGLTCVAAGFHSKERCRAATLCACLAVYAAFGCMVAPLSTPEAGYSTAVLRHMQGQRIAVPNGFPGQYERYEFVLPGNHLVPYDAEGRNTGAFSPDMPGAERLPYLLNQFDAAVWYQDRLDQFQPSCLPQCTLLGWRWHVKSRHKSGEVTLTNLWYPQQWLFRKEWLVTKSAGSHGK